MDPLFERRELVRVLSVPAKYIQRNIRGSLLAQLGSQIEGKCGVEGYVQPKSSVILDHSLGKMDMLHPGVRYRVRFHADICFPHKGQVFKAPVTFLSKIGIHSEISPIRVLLPRDLHIGNEEFESIQASDEIEFEVIGSEFKQNDDTIFVLGKLIKKVGAADTSIKKEEEVAPLISLPTFMEGGGGGDVKSVSFKETVKVDEPGKTVRKRKRLGGSSALQLNVDSEQTKEGKTESTS